MGLYMLDPRMSAAFLHLSLPLYLSLTPCASISVQRTHYVADKCAMVEFMFDEHARISLYTHTRARAHTHTHTHIHAHTCVGRIVAKLYIHTRTSCALMSAWLHRLINILSKW
jgi:hypothetical protein